MTSAEDIASDHVQFFSSNTKITALKSAVNSFIDVIAEDNPTSKIAIVKFAGDKKDTVGNDTYKEGRYTYNYTQIVQNLTEANTDGAASLKAAVNALTASGATAADYGLEKAIDVFGAAGQVPKDRNRVVIMFTDGEPNHDNGFDGRVAKAAIDKAKTLKNESYGASVYTIGIFDGASVGESLPANNDNGRTNRYMHLVSSNYPEASSMKDTGTGDVTKGFYKVASDANSLGSVFTQLGEAIGKPSIDLGSTAVLTDNIASNFIAPANVADVKVYTADYDGNSKTFGDWEDFPGDVKISGNAVTVTGFNYSANGDFTADEAKMGYVGAFTYAEVMSGYTSFFLGARSVCPTVTMDVTFTGSWYDETAEKEAANTLIKKGCKLISQHADSMGAPTACETAGVPNVSYNGSTESACPNTFIVSSRIDWAPYYEYAIKAVMNGETIDTDWTGTLKTGSVVLTDVNEKAAAAGTAEAIAEAKAKLEDGSLNVFDTATFTVEGKKLDSYMADVDTDKDYTKDTEVVENGVFYESKFRSAPYFDVMIDGINLLDTNFGS